jgi:Tat protein secretion system quality control protein TatD with DNase activity
MIRIWDAHCHRSLTGEPAVRIGDCEFGVQGCIINTTQPDDWPEGLAASSVSEERVVYLAGLHPWFIAAARDLPWRDRLADLLTKGVRGIGEIGLDGGRAKRSAPLPEQVAVFQWQLLQSAERNLPVSIHAVRASHILLASLKGMRLPERGIHLHDFYAPLAVMRQLQQMTEVWFSYGPRRLLHGNDEWLQQVLPTIPSERLLFETDCQADEAESRSDFEWPRALLRLAELRKRPVDELAAILNGNTQTYFGGGTISRDQ